MEKMSQPIDEKNAMKPKERMRRLMAQQNCVHLRDLQSESGSKYIDCGAEMLRLASEFQRHKDNENAFLLFSRYVMLFLKSIHQHHDYRRIEDTVLQIRSNIIQNILPLILTLGECLFKQYEVEYAEYLKTASCANAVAVGQSSMPPLAEDPIGGLRIVHVPEDTVKVFLQLAQSNTAKPIETIGVLTGHLAGNELHVTHIIVPQQMGTESTCSALHEEQLCEVQSMRQLITLGWIHTHPTQNAFMSSVDLHTHYSYQRMMPEAIAIVCAPRHQQDIFFVLTPDYGLDFIGRCQGGGFHIHKNTAPLAMKAEHIRMDSQSSIEVIDLRIEHA